jgi:hypothetical protein
VQSVSGGTPALVTAVNLGLGTLGNPAGTEVVAVVANVAIPVVPSHIMAPSMTTSAARFDRFQYLPVGESSLDSVADSDPECNGTMKSAILRWPIGSAAAGYGVLHVALASRWHQNVITEELVESDQ